MKPISEMTPMEIREAVATRVMGINIEEYRCEEGAVNHAALAHYEFEISPAFEVVDKCRAIGVYIEVIAMASMYTVNWQAYSDATTVLDAGTVRAKTLDQVPLAVCKSALAALEAIGSAK